MIQLGQGMVIIKNNFESLNIIITYDFKFFLVMCFVGPLANGIPSEIKGYWAAKERFGNPDMPWRSLFQPTIDMCRNGVTISWYLDIRLTAYEDSVREDPGLRSDTMRFVFL